LSFVLSFGYGVLILPKMYFFWPHFSSDQFLWLKFLTTKCVKVEVFYLYSVLDLVLSRPVSLCLLLTCWKDVNL